MNHKKVEKELLKLKNPQKGKNLARFFKTSKGEYGEGDIFLGISVGDQRKIAKKYPELTLKEIQKLLSSKIHEHRLTGLFILIAKYQKADKMDKKKIFSFYLKNAKNINNWDLVDVSAPKILGDYLLEKDKQKSCIHRRSTLDAEPIQINKDSIFIDSRFRGNDISSISDNTTNKCKTRDKSILYKLAKSKNLWERRIAIMATFAFIRNNQFEKTLEIAEMFLQDEDDLIHKAVGWMLREVGKKDQETEEKFLKKHCQKMPRTMLRYAIERFNEKKRQSYLKKSGKIEA